jgi:hypothetical protein
METLACEQIVFRALTRRGWVDPMSKRILPAAFFRRPSPKDDDGLSVDTKSAESSISQFNTCFGAASLHVGRIRNLNLDVLPDSADHANIVGVPRQAEDAAQAEWFASQLAKQARFVEIRKND